jgi:hypothetical protein
MSRKTTALFIPGIVCCFLLYAVSRHPSPAPPPADRAPRAPVPEVAQEETSKRNPFVHLPPPAEPRPPTAAAVGSKVPGPPRGERDWDDECADFPELLAIKDWPEFYRKCDSRALDPELFTELIIRHVCCEGALTKSQGDTLRKLLEIEHATAAQEALKEYGKNTLGAVLNAPDETQGGYADVWKGLAKNLDNARRRIDRDYAAVFDPAQMSLINEHLRNANLTLCTEYRRDNFGTNLGQDLFWVVGVGVERLPLRQSRGGGNPLGDWEMEWRRVPSALK